MSPRARSAAAFRIGEWQVDPDDRTLSSGSRQSYLSPLQLDLLVYLADHAGRVVTRSEILETVWAGSQIEEGGITRCVSELRKALGDNAREPRYIETIPKTGYRLLAPIDEPGSRPGGSRSGLAAILAVGLLGVLGAWWALGPGAQPTDPTGAAAEQPPSLAVLGFSNQTTDPLNDWLEPGLTEMLATELALSARLRVIPPSAVSRLLQDYSIDDSGTLNRDAMRRVARSTGADFVVTGSLSSTAGDSRALLDVSLWNEGQAQPVASFSEAGSLEDPHSLVALTGTRLRDALGLPDLTQGERATVDGQLSRDAAARRLYYTGLRHLRRFEAAQARAALEQSLSIDRGQPFARIALAEALAALGYDALAETAARSAIESAGKLPREHRLWIEARFQAMVADWDAAIERYRALRLFAPESAEYGLALANTLLAAGRAEQALELVAVLQQSADPESRDPRLELAAGEAHLALSEYEEALAAAGSAIEQAAEIGAPRLVALVRRLRATALYALGQITEAKAELSEVASALATTGDPSNEVTTRLSLAGWLADEGELAEAAEILRAALDIARQAGDRSGEASAMRSLGRLLEADGDPEGRALIRQSIALHRELGDRVAEATAIRTLAIALASRGSQEEAYPLFEQLLSLYRDLGNQEYVGLTLMNLGRVHLLKGEVRRALELLAEAEGVLEPLGLPNRLASLRINLGWGRLLVGDLDGAESAFAAATAAYRKLDNNRLVAVGLYSLGGVSRMRGNLAKARAELDESLELRQKMGSAARIAVSQLGISQLLYEEGDLAGAEAAALAARDSYTQASHFHGECTRMLVLVYLAQGRLEEAAAAVEEGSRLLGGLGTQDESHLFLIMAAAQLAEASGDPTRAVDLLDQVLQATGEEGSWILHTEAELARAGVLLRTGREDEARATLAAIEHSAERRGWTSMAAKARAGRTSGGPLW